MERERMEFEDRLREIADRGAKETSQEWMENIEQEYGRTPLIFRRMAEAPEVLISHLLYKGTVTQTSTLHPKYVELISLAVGAALRCQHCTGYHMQAALKKGATREDPEAVDRRSYFNSSVLANAYRL
jgi:AhpD family alkylhydroperoxidase